MALNLIFFCHQMQYICLKIASQLPQMLQRTNSHIHVMLDAKSGLLGLLQSSIYLCVHYLLTYDKKLHIRTLVYNPSSLLINPSHDTLTCDQFYVIEFVYNKLYTKSSLQERVRQLLEAYTRLPVVLGGMFSQLDPRLYDTMVSTNTHQQQECFFPVTICIQLYVYPSREKRDRHVHSTVSTWLYAIGDRDRNYSWHSCPQWHRKQSSYFYTFSVSRPKIPPLIITA